MAFIEAPTNFYLGRTFDPQKQRIGEDVVYYDSRDLKTHAVVVGMTGSGKTGLCISLLEEAILDNIPAIIIDPKGDITNLMLNFPDMRPEDFRPWIHPDQAQRAGMDVDTYAKDKAQEWRDGLANWGIVPDRLRWMKGATQLSIYTPGSDAGLPISILASLRAPRIDWNTQAESVRERITGIVTALYALAGISVEPVKDAEHVLLSNIFEYNWRQGRDLTLEDIILQIQQPPFEKLGVFPVDQYITEKKRFKIAMEMNNIIASPSFQSWMQGDPLDISSLLYQPNGRPRVSIFYTAHLNDQERMFITTLLLESMIGWMRTLSGTPSLRALLYIDEMYGYFPSHPKNPPSKKPIMTLLKQARAFGIGLVLATQNPGDLDYKGLSNAGTWFIGRLQSANDKKRIMAGIQEMASADEGLDLNDVANMIANIQPRVFLMRNVHNTGGPILMHTRWAMSYLAGPITRNQISWLMQAQRQAMAQRIVQEQYSQQYGAQNYNLQGGQQQSFNAPPPPPGMTQGGFGQQQSGFNAPPPPPGMSGGFGQQQSGFNAPPPPPGMSGGFGQQQSGFNAPPPPQGMSGGFGAQSAPQYGQGGGFNQPLQPTGGFNAQSTGSMNTGSQARSNSGVPGYVNNPPPVASAIQQFYLPTVLSSQQAMMNYEQQTGRPLGNPSNVMLAYRSMLFAQLAVRYQQKSAQIYTTREYAFHIPDLHTSGLVHWEEFQSPVFDRRQIAAQPFGDALFEELPLGLTDEKRMKALQGELTDFMYNTARLIIPHHVQFKIYGNPDDDMSVFQGQVVQVAREKRDVEVDKLNNKFGKLADGIEDKIRRKERELEAEKLEIRDRKREQLYTTGEAVFSLFQGRTNYTLSRMSRASRYKRQTEADIQESRDVLGELQGEMGDLEQDYEAQLQAIDDKWAKVANQVNEYTITPYKKDIHIEMYGIGWIPHYYMVSNGQPIIISALT